MRATLAVFLVLLLVPTVARADDLWELFDELRRGVDVEDPAAVEAAHELLQARDAAYLTMPLAPSRLRAALARRPSPEAVRHLLGERLAKKDVDGALSVVWNLSGRPDLAAIVAATPGWEAMLDHEEGEKIVESGATILRPVARAGLRSGNRDLAIALLRDPRTTERMANTLSESHDAHGLRLLADVVTGKVSIAAPARAVLATFEPDISNIYGDRPLGAAQVAALAKTAEADPDPHMRAVAARILLRSAMKGGAAVTARAYRGAPSWLVDEQEWAEIAKMWWIEPMAGLELSDAAWERLLRSTIYLSHVRARDMPEDAEGMAGLLLRHAESPMDARRRGLFLRLVEQLDYAFLDDTEGPWWGVPTREKILANLEATRADDPPELADLARRVASRLRLATLGEETRRPKRGAKAEAGEHAPEVWSRLPARGARDAPIDGAEIEAWLELDPLHLFDPDVSARFRSWSRALRARVLGLYPRSVMKGWLASPPARTRVPGRHTFFRDPQRRVARARILRLLVDAPTHQDLLSSEVPVASWPTRSRQLLGDYLHRLLPELGMDALRTRLEDDAVAAGFALAAIEKPHGVADLAFAADLLTSTERRDATALIVDAEEYGPSERLGGDSDDWPSSSVPLDAPRREALARVLEEAADPWRALLAARILGLGATPADLEVLLSPAGDRLDAGTTRSSHVLSDLAAHVRTPAHLEVVLAFLADREISSRARVEVLDDLIYADFYLRDTDPEDLSPGADAMRDRFFAWVADEAGKIDLETSEGLMHTLAGRLPEEKAREVIEAMRKAIDAWSAEGPRLRMRERLDELVEELEES